MTEPAIQSRRKLIGAAALLAVAAGLGATGFCFHNSGSVAPIADDKDKEGSGLGGTTLFATWPKGKPDAVIVLSGQTFGHVQPCGCSRPQLGGLERRANFMASMRKKGWPVIGVDLGDIYPDRHPLGAPPIKTPEKQALLKYISTMNALREMGYIAIGAGQTELSTGIATLVQEYGLQVERAPFTLAGNLAGKTAKREDWFTAGPDRKRALVGLAEIADFGGLQVGIAGLIGKAADDKGLDKEVPKFDDRLVVNGGKVTLDAAASLLKKTAVNVLLYQGTPEFAKKVAEDRSEYDVILCLSEDSEPPQFPETVNRKGGGKTMIIQVGHKGRYVGVVGVFKTDAGYDLKYQLVPLGEEWLTPNTAEAEKDSKVLRLLEEYAAKVQSDNMLGMVRPVAHPAQIQADKLNLTYIGSDKCKACHGGEHKKWTDTPHSKAMEALEKIAKRPSLRNLDAECVICHTVGFGFKTGYENETKTPELKNVQCESCHGPGSGHASAEKNETFLKLMSPWKTEKGDKLPDVAMMDKLAKMDPVERGRVAIPQGQLRVINAVSNACQKCHDVENDPHFDLYKYWPKIAHSGLGAAPKK